MEIITLLSSILVCCLASLRPQRWRKYEMFLRNFGHLPGYMASRPRSYTLLLSPPPPIYTRVTSLRFLVDQKSVYIL
jgi:hypothetical protein